MSNNVKIRQKNSAGEYDVLFPKSAANVVMLSEETSAAYSLENGTAEDAANSLIGLLTAQRRVSLRVTDSANHPIEGATVSGLIGTPTTDTNGVVTGVAQNNNVTISPPSSYQDLKSMVVNIANYIGKLNTYTVVLSPVANNTIIRYLSSQTIRFSAGTKSIDICCVAAGGGGGGYFSGTESQVGGGGGGGGIVNTYNVPVTPYANYSIVVGLGGSVASPDYGGDGGDSSFGDIVTANGGKGGTPNAGGLAGATNCGTGGYNSYGYSNTTITEFDDGVTFYSGGGGSGRNASSTTMADAYNGGSPNGANGALVTKRSQAGAGTAGIGGGGGGGAYIPGNQQGATLRSSAGGNGLVAIRIHTDYEEVTA